ERAERLAEILAQPGGAAAAEGFAARAVPMASVSGELARADIALLRPDTRLPGRPGPGGGPGGQHPRAARLLVPAAARRHALRRRTPRGAADRPPPRPTPSDCPSLRRAGCLWDWDGCRAGREKGVRGDGAAVRDGGARGRGAAVECGVWARGAVDRE
ncbi:hypothetical protein CLM85_26755, partial [Streptomyces albidoflavus]